MAAELSQDELLLLGRCPFFRGAEDELLQRVLALPGVFAQDFAAGQTVYQGSYGSIVLEAVTDVSETGCTLQFSSSGGQDADGKACLVSGALPGEDGLLTAEVSASPAGCQAEFGTEAGFTSTGNTFVLHLTEENSADAATPENASRQVTLTLRNLPQIILTAKK